MFQLGKDIDIDILIGETFANPKTRANFFGETFAIWQIEEISRDKLSRMEKLKRFFELNFRESQFLVSKIFT